MNHNCPGPGRPAGPDQPCRCRAAVNLNQHVLGRNAGGGGIRVNRTAPPSAARRVEIAGIDGFHFAQDRAVRRRIGHNPPDPGVPLAAVEKQPIDALHCGLRSCCQDDLPAAAFPEHSEDFLVRRPLPDGSDHTPGEIEGQRGGPCGQQSGKRPAANDAA